MSLNASRVLCNINSQSVRQTLCLPESNLEQSFPFDEEILIRLFRQTNNEVKLGFMSSLLRPDHVLEKLSFPYDLQALQDCVKPLFALLSQILGLDNEK